MSEGSIKTNSLKLSFERNSKEPTEPEIFDFMKVKMKLKADNLLSMYKDRSDAAVIIKFKTEDAYKATLARLPGIMEFSYNKYQSAQVSLSPAGVVVKYVRLFNLPPEVEDQEIGTVLAKYGKVQRLVREKYGEDTGFPIWTSVRGAYVELKKGVEIPGSIHVRNIRTRVFYYGLINKCFQCGEADHLKAVCPKRRTVNSRLGANGAASYSEAVANGVTGWKTVKRPDTATEVNPEEQITSDETTKETNGETEKRQLSPSNLSNGKQAKIARTVEKDGTPSDEGQQQQTKQDGEDWCAVPEKKGRKPKKAEASLETKKGATGAANTSEPQLRPRRKMTISEFQAERDRSRSGYRRYIAEKERNDGAEKDSLEGTFLAKTFDESL